MEDRTTAGLYLEMGDGPADGFRRRAEALAERAGVDRVTWWENCVPGRRDLPMRIEDRSMLAVAEVTAGFSAPEAPAGATAHCFRRHRASQPGRPHRTTHQRPPGGVDQPPTARAGTGSARLG